MFRFRTVVGLIVFGLVFSVAFIADAKRTPDNKTPSEETVCDPLSGALFGLCNAYCEALDCDSEEGYMQHPTACMEVYENFVNKSNVIEPPCICVDECIADAQICAVRVRSSMETQRLCRVECDNADNPRICFEQCLVREARRICTPLFEECVESCYDDEPIVDPR